MSKEIICINIGQAGVQISNSCWELFCIEHGLDSAGNVRSGHSQTSVDQFGSNFDTFFTESHTGSYVPRSISIDLEPSVIDEIRVGPYRKLWNPDYLISGLEDASNNFGRGYISIGKTMIGGFMKTLSNIIQECDKLHGIIFLQSYCGGTGSGFTNLILESIKDEYAKTTGISNIVFPSPIQATSVVEPYNCVLAAAASLDNIDVAFLTDNQSLYDICLKKMSIEAATFIHINRLISQLYSSLTVTLRFHSSLDHDIAHLQTNLIPFPRLHFPVSTFAPIGDHSKSEHEGITTSEMTHQLFDDDNRFISCNNSCGKYMACCLHYRGLVKPKEINMALMEIKNRKDIMFVDWSPVGFKIGISPMPPASVANTSLGCTNKNCSMFFNSTAIETVWNVIHNKFESLYRKKSFLHWFLGEGMEEMDFLSSDENICKLQKDYQEVGDQTDEWIDENCGTENPRESSELQNQNDISSDDKYLSDDLIPNFSVNDVEIETKKVSITADNSKDSMLNGSPVYYESNMNNSENCSTNRSNRSLYSIAKSNLKARLFITDNECSKNRQLLKLFLDGSS